jgi:2-dehydro-3-deoxyphosphogluconate aldolase/(4S)-4-hydroxy-2-oxoglutarate aldolase
MNQTIILPKLEDEKLVPVIRIDRIEDAEAIGEALCAGGLPVAEVTFRTDAAEEAIKILKKKFPEMLVGAGTVINQEQAKRAQAAGVSFIVSPGISCKVLEFAVDNNIPVFPGVCTPTEIMTAVEYGLEVLKFFPAKQYGGVNTIKTFSSVFPSVRFMPTGGINQENICEYLKVKSVIACGGSWMVKNDLIDKGKFDEIRRLSAEAVEIVRNSK